MKHISIVLFCCVNLIAFNNVYSEQTVVPPLNIKPSPDEKTTVITQIQIYSLSGQYTEAEKKLAEYKSKYGEDTAYLTENARYLALTGRSSASLIMLEPLLKNDPKNKTLNDIKQYALTHPENRLNSTPITKEEQDKQTLIKKIYTELTQGNYAAGSKDLASYEKRYGKDDDFLTEAARYYALTGHSEKALEILEPLMKKKPGNRALTDIHTYVISHLGQTAKSKSIPVQESPLEIANRLEKQATAHSTDPVLFIKAAQAYRAAKNDQSALNMVNKAILLKPTEYDYFKLQAEIATSINDYQTAYLAYKRIYPLDPNNAKVLLAYARVSSYYNSLDESAKLYSIYIKRYPNDAKPWLEAAYVHNWIGDYRGAVSLLDQYVTRFGESKDYLIERSRILASANRPYQALTIIDQLLPSNNLNYDLNYAKTTALFYGNKPIQMFQSLKKVNEIAPESNQTFGLNEFIRTPYRSNIGLDAYHSHDTDTVDISRTTLYGQYYLSPVTSVIGNMSGEVLKASLNSGLNPIEGGHSITLYRYNMGVTHRINPNLALSGVLGGANVSDKQDAFIYQGDAFFMLNDYTRVNLESKRNYYDVSARAVSLGVKQNLNQINLLFEPCLQCYLNVNTSYSYFSDTNTMKYASATLLRNFIASQMFNLNLGLSGQWDGFEKQLNHGYYNPSYYQYYGFIFDLYMKQNDNVGYGINIGLGKQKDENFTKFTGANDYSAKAFLGIYKDLYLVLSGGYSSRIRAVYNNPGMTPYSVYAFNATLTRRLD